jgi:hypothetical protein
MEDVDSVGDASGGILRRITGFRGFRRFRGVQEVQKRFKEVQRASREPECPSSYNAHS